VYRTSKAQRALTVTLIIELKVLNFKAKTKIDLLKTKSPGSSSGVAIPIASINHIIRSNTSGANSRRVGNRCGPSKFSEIKSTANDRLGKYV